MMVPARQNPREEPGALAALAGIWPGGPVPTATLNVLNPLGAIAMVAELLVAGRLCFVRYDNINAVLRSTKTLC